MRLFISKIIYQLAVSSYNFFIGLISLFNEKAYKFSKGRSDQEILHQKEQTLWFHCASLGEFEQAKPLMKWCYENLNTPIILSFFSPSGYTYKNNYALAKAVYYLPADSPANAKDFVKKVNPKVAFFIKYEFWYFYLQELKKRHIPHFLVAGIFRKEQLFFKSYGVLHKQMLASFTHLFVQDENSLNLLQDHGRSNVSLAFDTRFDSVKQISQLNFHNEVIEQFIQGKKTLVVGSSWQKDENIVKKVISDFEQIQVIIAPHEVNAQRIKQIQEQFKHTVILSNPIINEQSRVLIIDNVGKLSLLYRYADICYIGGGFGVSVHNVLEAAVYGKALVYGPNHQKSKEAVDLNRLGAAIVIDHAEDLKEALTQFSNPTVYKEACKTSERYVAERTGGTQSIMNKLKEDKVI